MRSRSQIARVVTEDWCAREMYCPGCAVESLDRTRPGSPSCDFICNTCEERYELKSCKHQFGARIPDFAYSSMLDAIRSDRTPNLLAIQYSPTFSIVNLFVVPRYFITETVIEKRPPLGAHARRAGWVGCNILLNRIPIDGQITVVREGVPAAIAEVRARFLRAKQLKKLPVAQRSWTVDVLNAIRSLNQAQFSLADIYGLDADLAKLHPNNRNIRPKIRQQLQVLRDMGVLAFVTPGQYKVVS